MQILSLLFTILPVVALLPAAAGAQATYQVVSSRVVVEHPGGMPALCRAANGDLLLAYATHWQPIPPPGGAVKLLRSTDGGMTWSKPKVVVEPKDATNWSIHMWSGLHLMPDGSIILAYGQNLSEQVAEAYLIRSTDHGKTWGDPIRLGHEMVKWNGNELVVPFAEGFGHPVTASNGNVLVPIGARREGGFYGTKASAFIRSTDNGKTWGPLEFIATGPEKFSETSLGVSRSGTLIAILRCDTTRRVLWQSTSHDNGRSWTRPTRTKTRADARDYVHGKMPDVLCLPTGRILLAVGSLEVGDGSEIWQGEPGRSYCGLYVSDDDGKTWRPDARFPSAQPKELIPYDAPVLTAAGGGRIIALSIQADRRTKNNPLAGWTMGAHFVLHELRENN